MISKALEKNKNLEVNDLCFLADVSRSGFYKWRSRPERKRNNDDDEVIKIFFEKHQKAGYRTLKMHFERRFRKAINHKKILRIKRENDLNTKIRRINRFRAIKMEGNEHSVLPNLVQRKFADPNLVLVDITEMKIMNGQKSYVFAMKNALTREIVGLNVSSNPSVALVTDEIERFFSSTSEKYIVHSDQGMHFTCGEYRKILNNKNAIQSMSRKANCLDNAPIESFFGHMKDEVDYKRCKTIEELKCRLKSYVHYYNNERPQWSLERKTPAEARVLLGLVY